MKSLNGVINIYKEKGYTSHDVVNIVRKTLNRVKTGHTGTLDPEALGVLPVCVGKATKISEFLLSEDKVYRASVKLGITTDTYDIWGKIISEKKVEVNLEDIEKVCNSFLGQIEQLPPMYSAIKVGGKKLYELARKGIEIERKTRKVTISEISVFDFNGSDEFYIDISCSKGTYIRSLCHDIGEKLGCGAAMSSLIRTKTGKFSIDDSIKLADLIKISENDEIDKIIIPIDEVLSDYKKVYVSERADKFLYNGNKVNLSYVTGDTSVSPFLCYNNKNELIGIYEIIDDFIKPITMLI